MHSIYCPKNVNANETFFFVHEECWITIPVLYKWYFLKPKVSSSVFLHFIQSSKKTAGKETGLLMKYKIIRIKVLKELNLSLLAKHHVFNSASYAKEVKKAGKYPVHSYLPFNNYNIHNSFYKHYGCCKIVNLVSLCSKCELFISLSF